MLRCSIYILRRSTYKGTELLSQRVRYWIRIKGSLSLMYIFQCWTIQLERITRFPFGISISAPNQSGNNKCDVVKHVVHKRAHWLDGWLTVSSLHCWKTTTDTQRLSRTPSIHPSIHPPIHSFSHQPWKFPKEGWRQADRQAGREC